MKKRKLISAVAMTLFLSTAMLSSNAQCATSDLQIPDTAYKDRVGKFATSPLLDKLNGNVANGHHPRTAGTIPLSTFIYFLKSKPQASTGLKIYFGAVNESASSKFNNLVVIFVFTKQDTNGPASEFDDYYILDSDQGTIEPIKKDKVQEFHTHFRTGLDMQDEVHLLWYPMASLDGWIDAIECQRKKNAAIKQLVFDWAIYNKVINHPHGGTGQLHVLNKLTLLLKIPYATPMKTYNKDGGFDTAVPCPPGQNCYDGMD